MAERTSALGYDHFVRKVFAFASVVLWVAACSSNPTGPNSPSDAADTSDLAMSMDDMRGSSDVDMSGSPADFAGCTFQYGTTTARETSSATIIAPHGGMTDHASVVSIDVDIAGMPAAVLTIRYQTGIANCTQATFPRSAAMTSSGGSTPGYTTYVGTIPAQPTGTHVCWRISAAACGGNFTDPPTGMVSYDYTTI